METQFITDKKGKRIAIILPIKDYNKILEKIDEIEDIKLYDQVKNNQENSMAAEEVFSEIDRER